MRTRSSKKQLKNVERESQTLKKKEEKCEVSTDSSDADLDRLVDFALAHMKKTRVKESGRLHQENESGWVEDLLPLNGLTESSVVSSNKKESILRVARVPTEERVPQGLDSGFDMELLEPKPEIPNRETDIRQILVKSSQDKLLKRSVLTPDLEKQHNIQPYANSRRSERKERKKIRDSKAGDEWYNMKAVEMTPELQNDLKAIQMRSVLDPKRFYRKNDMKTLPKFFQVGTVMDSSVDFYHARVSRKQRRQTIVDELLADAETRRYNKRKYMELQIHRSLSKRRRRMLKH